MQLHVELVAAHHDVAPLLEPALGDAEDVGVLDRDALTLVAGKGIGVLQPVTLQPRAREGELPHRRCAR